MIIKIKVFVLLLFCFTACSVFQSPEKRIQKIIKKYNITTDTIRTIVNFSMPKINFDTTTHYNNFDTTVITLKDSTIIRIHILDSILYLSAKRNEQTQFKEVKTARLEMVEKEKSKFTAIAEATLMGFGVTFLIAVILMIFVKF